LYKTMIYLLEIAPQTGNGGEKKKGMRIRREKNRGVPKNPKRRASEKEAKKNM